MCFCCADCTSTYQSTKPAADGSVLFSSLIRPFGRSFAEHYMVSGARAMHRPAGREDWLIHHVSFITWCINQFSLPAGRCIARAPETM